jgi:hypothetical protein
MKNQSILVAGTILLHSTFAWALPTIQVQKGLYQADFGGEFKVTVTGSDNPQLPVGTTMQTFCLEYNEHIGFNRTYYVDINTKTLRGGVGGGPEDPLDPATAWLYNQFADGVLVKYDFANSGVGRKQTARSLQKAIWYLEEEISFGHLDTLAREYVDLAQASDWKKNNTFGNVRVLNLWKNINSDGVGTGYAQDQLCRLPTVPAPGAVLLGSLGAVMVGGLRKRYLNG